MAEDATHAFDLERNELPTPGYLATLGVMTVDTMESPLRVSARVLVPFPQLIRDTQEVIKQRVVDRILADPTQDCISKVFSTFVSLWLAETLIMRSWIQEEPVDNFEVMTDNGQTRSRWLSGKATNRLGNDACARLASAAHARGRISHEIWRLCKGSMSAPIPLTNERADAFTSAVLITDFGLSVAERVLHIKTDPRIPREFADWLSSEAMKNSRTAYGLLAVPDRLRTSNSVAAQ